MWDYILREEIETPKEILEFLKDIKCVCIKHNMCISHEDGHGSFLIERYNERCINWLNDAGKDYK